MLFCVVVDVNDDEMRKGGREMSNFSPPVVASGWRDGVGGGGGGGLGVEIKKSKCVGPWVNDSGMTQ